MDQQTLLTIMTIFVAISGIALLVQMGMLIGIYRATKAIENKTAGLVPKVHSLVESSQKAVEDSKQHIVEVAAKANALLDSSRVQLTKVDTLLTEASGRARVQMDRAEMVLDDTMSRAQETVAMLHGGVTRPLREIHGLAAGIRTAVAYLARGSRPSVDRVTHDDEMFI
jgi:ABC-type transporter Mla subunit MlaD